MQRLLHRFDVIAKEQGLWAAAWNVLLWVFTKLGLKQPTTIAGMPADIASQKHPLSVMQNVIPLPPLRLMVSIGSQSVEDFLMVGDAYAQRILAEAKDKDLTLMDVGMGCGRFARHLVRDSRVKKYIGFDVIRENIAWCDRFIKPMYPNKFSAHFFDLYSKEYNPTATLKASDLKFPAEAQSVDIIFAKSLFTHLLEPDAKHYLAETARVLKKDGVALYTIHTQPTPGTEYDGNESRIDVKLDYFAKLANQVGLELKSSEPSFYKQTLLRLIRRQSV